MVSEELAKEFQEIMKEDYGKEISVALAVEMMSGMVKYYDLLAKLYHSKKLETPELSADRG